MAETLSETQRAVERVVPDWHCHGCKFWVSALVVGTTCADSALLPPAGGARAGHNQPMCKHLQGEIQINYVIFEIKV